MAPAGKTRARLVGGAPNRSVRGVLAHAAFAKPETPLERARAGWKRVFSMAVSSLEDEEAKYAVRQLAADTSEEEWERFSHRREDLARRRENVFKLDD